jgi:hypothetical protein
MESMWSMPVTNNQQRAPIGLRSFVRTRPPLPGTTRHSKPARLAADVHLPALTIITRHYATLGTANF